MSEEFKVNFQDAETSALFYKWLKKVRAEAWDEGFDAGERDVWMHEEKNDWGQVDTKCIPNPYREEESK